MAMKVKDAVAITGPLSKPSKMPGKAWGIPAEHCITGGILRGQEGSVCSICYACRGRFVMPAIQLSYQRRLDKWVAAVEQDGLAGVFEWEDAMVTQIDSYFQSRDKARKLGEFDPMKDGEYFRWLDSGDLQSEEMLKSIMTIARHLPWVKFYLPTKEQKIVRSVLSKYPCPANLIVRVSGSRIDGPAPNFEYTSVVETMSDESAWKEKCEGPSGSVAYCPAEFQSHECQRCRQCWNPEVKTVVYAKT